MEKLINLTKDEEQSVPYEIRMKFKDLRKLALKGLELDRKVTASISLGQKTFVNDSIQFPLIVEFKRNNKVVSGHPIESIEFDGENILDEKVVTDSKGRFSILGSTKNINHNVRVAVEYKDSNGNIKRTETCFPVEKMSEPKANKLSVTIPGSTGLEVNKLDKNGCFAVHLLTSLNGKGLESRVQINSSHSWEYISSSNEGTKDDHKTLQIPKEGNALLTIKPSDGEYQAFVISLLGTDQIARVVYHKAKADKLSITIPGLIDNVVYEATAPDSGFIINLQILLVDKNIDDTVIATSSHGFKLKSGSEPILDESAEHHIAVTSIKTITVYPTKDWQKINFGTEFTIPKTIEFRKRS